jgi:tRNA dimethylallyltransferase
MNKVLIILGPTATGKSSLAVKLAKKYNGEVISADSRQVYKGLNIGTGKITKKEMRGIPHYMLDVISPKKVFSVSDWQKQTKKIVEDILSRGKLPIICGGTGFYIQSIVDNITLPEVPPNKVLRKKLEGKTLLELNTILKKLDKKRCENIDTKNPVRLIRAIEIATKLGKVPTLQRAQGKDSLEFLQIGLTLPDKELKNKINKRLLSRIKSGMIKEAQNLHKNGLSWKRMRQLGLEYRYLADYVEKRMTETEFIQKLETEIWRYAKRQMTWFRRDKEIKWFTPNQMKKIEEEINRWTY